MHAEKKGSLGREELEEDHKSSILFMLLNREHFLSKGVALVEKVQELGDDLQIHTRKKDHQSQGINVG
jgi:hypothetical protein